MPKFGNTILGNGHDHRCTKILSEVEWGSKEFNLHLEVLEGVKLYRPYT